MTNYTRKAITNRAIEKMKVGETLADIAENEGLRVTRGARGVTFWYRYRHPVTGKLKRLTIGHLRDMHLASARVELQELKGLRLKGVDPASVVRESKRKEKEEAERRHSGFTFADMIEDYLKRTVYPRRKEKGAKEAERMLNACVVSILGERLAADLTRRDILEVINKQIDAGNSVQAGRLLCEMVAAFEQAILRDSLPDDFANPAVLAQQSLKASNVSLSPRRRKRVISDDELKVWWEWLNQPGIVTPNHRRAMMLTLQVGCRSGEAISARWRQFNLDDGTWHLGDTKTGVSRTVRLPRQVRDWLNAERLLRPNDEWLCPSPKGGHVQQKSITERLWLLKTQDKLPKIEPWVPHDLRRTCRTGLARLKCPHEVAEAAMGHVVGGVAGIYNLHKYESEVGDWLQRWCDRLDEVIGKS
ncbi:MAG: hypothetical protein B6D73_10800 [gamma proteobacterium symbiont of Stewartia floridana]|nr:MAG: hypothetical protein B6D73_10800 [gamma proteobacterium symbiont of Stewartia floridana]